MGLPTRSALLQGRAAAYIRRRSTPRYRPQSGASAFSFAHCGVARTAGGITVVAAIVGGVTKGGLAKSNISIGGVAFASRAVSAGSPKRASMKRRIDV